MMVELIVAVTGLPGSGKSTFAMALAEALRAPVVVMGDLVREEVKRRGLEVTPANVEAVATELRARYGRGAVGELAKALIVSFGNRFVVVDGVRSPEEVTIFRSIAPTCVAAVHSSPRTRLVRLLARSRPGEGSEDLFRFRDTKNLEYGIAEVIATADYMVVNEGDLDSLRAKALELAREIEDGAWKSRC